MLLTKADPTQILADLATGLKAGTVAPYLGPGISELAAPAAPMSAPDLAAFFGTRVALPRRAIGNVWASAQHIESFRHRSTVTTLMREAFAEPVGATAFHSWLAGLGLPLIVDSWYASEMRRALATQTDWIEVQGVTRAHVAGGNVWFRFYGPDGEEAMPAAAEAARTLLYTPHGAIEPAANFLISDSDYVEVLTEIDIQTPIPEAVRNRRTDRAFLFLGCRFDDQMLRSYARQIMKRSRAQHHAVVDLAKLTRNERRFLDEQGIVPIDMPLGDALKALIDA